MKKTTTKRIVWACLINGFGWVWCSYVLAWCGRTDIAESLSKLAITEIVGVVLMYCLKSLFEKRLDFGSVGATKKTDTSETSEEETAEKRDC